jgi:hypothetical protein
MTLIIHESINFRVQHEDESFNTKDLPQVEARAIFMSTAYEIDLSSL